jgi:hypothetical protein
LNSPCPSFFTAIAVHNVVSSEFLVSCLPLIINTNVIQNYFSVMRSVHVWICLCCILLAEVTTSRATPSPTATHHHHGGVGTCAAKNASNNNNSNNNIFGVPEAKLAQAAAVTKAAVQELRGGGDLHEPETLQDVEALVLNAATNRQLVVIDFTASWCGPVSTVVGCVRIGGRFYSFIVELFVFTGGISHI